MMSFKKLNIDLIFIIVLLVSLLFHLSTFTAYPSMNMDELTVLETGRIGCVKNIEDGCCYIPKDFDINVFGAVRGGTRLYWKMFEIWMFLPRLFSILMLHVCCFFLYALLNKISADKKISLICVAVFLFDPALVSTVRMARCDIVSITLYFIAMLLLNKCSEISPREKKRLLLWIAAVSIATILPFWWITSGFYVIPLAVYAIYVNREVWFKKTPRFSVDLPNFIIYIGSAAFTVIFFSYVSIFFLLGSRPTIGFFSEVLKTLAGEKYLDLSYFSRFLCYMRGGSQNIGAFLLTWFLSVFLIKKTWVWFLPFAAFVILALCSTPIYYARMAYMLPCAVLSLAVMLSEVPPAKRFYLFLIILVGLMVSLRYSILGRTYKGIFKKQKYSKQYLFTEFSSIPIDKTILSDSVGKMYSLYEIGHKYHWKMYAYIGGGGSQDLIAKYNIQWAVLPVEEDSQKIEMLRSNNFVLVKTIAAPVVSGEENCNGSWQIWHREL